MRIPQYIEYKLNTCSNLEDDEIDLLSELINKSDDPKFILNSYTKLQWNHKNLIAAHFKINNTIIDAAICRNYFSWCRDLKKEIDELIFGKEYYPAKPPKL